MGADISKLVEAGPIASIVRVGHAPLGEDDPIEIAFANGALFHIDVGFEGASDIRVTEGALLDGAFGHLHTEEPETFAAIERAWIFAPLDLPWLIGATLTNPRRLAMTNPYRLDIGYAFDVGVRTFVLFGEADYITATTFDDSEIASLALEIGAPL